jgi:hypothetical protein
VLAGSLFDEPMRVETVRAEVIAGFCLAVGVEAATNRPLNRRPATTRLQVRNEENARIATTKRHGV